MVNEIIYVQTPAVLKRSMEELMMDRRRRGLARCTLTSLIIQACDELLTRELPGYTSQIEAVSGGRTARSRGTHQDEILGAVANLTCQDRHIVFTRQEVRDHLGIDSKTWLQSYTPIFQGMRADQPGGAPGVRTPYKNVFRRIDHGRYVLTDVGEQRAREYVEELQARL
jgi:hypothetical protein